MEAIEALMDAMIMENEFQFGIERMYQSAYHGDLDPFQHAINHFRGQEDFLVTFLGGKTEEGKSFLHFAAAGGSNGVCKLLLEEGKLDIDYKDFIAGETPLHYAVKERRISTVVLLLENGADINARSKMRRISLHYAVERGYNELIRFLISKGADINAVAADCGTPLQLAAGQGSDESVKLLLEHNADPNVTSHDMFSPLMAAIRAESLKCMELLLKARADPNFCGHKGMTPLAYAASKGLKGIVKCLLNAKADPNATNSLGMKPLEQAALNDKRGVVGILFPITSPIPTIPKWTVSKLFRQVNSNEAREERERKEKELYLLSKSKGAEYFNKKNYLAGIQWYTQALSFKPDDAAALSERSLCWARMNEGGLALDDAEACIKLMPNWSEAHYRAGSAHMLISPHAIDKAIDAFVHGLTLDPENKTFQHALRDAHEAKLFSKTSRSSDFM